MMLEDETYILDLPRVSQTLDFTCGAACFESMFQFFFKRSHGELYFAEKLGTLELGYTDPQSIVDLAKQYSLLSELKIESDFENLKKEFFKGAVVFVTWWDEDAGHYSLIKKMEERHILLMDPWAARVGCDTYLPIEDFLNYWKMRASKMISVTHSLT